MAQNQRGTTLLPVLLTGLILALVANSIRDWRMRVANDAGSIVHAGQVQAVLNRFARLHDRYPTTLEFNVLMSVVSPLYPGLTNTHTHWTTEPRTLFMAYDPGAINLSISSDCCSDTIRIIGMDQTVIHTIIGHVDGRIFQFGGVAPKHPDVVSLFRAFPHG